jgi:hypothetical protein
MSALGTRVCCPACGTYSTPPSRVPHNRMTDQHAHVLLNGCVQARVAVMMREQRQQVDSWRQQNEADQRADMQQLEGLMLRVGPPVVSSSRTSPSLPRPCGSLPCSSEHTLWQLMLVYEPCMSAGTTQGSEAGPGVNTCRTVLALPKGGPCCCRCSTEPSCSLWHVTPVAVTMRVCMVRRNDPHPAGWWI